MFEWLPLFILGAVLMESGMGRAKGSTHCFIKGLTALAIGSILGSLGGNFREALLCGTTTSLAVIGLGDRLTLKATTVLAIAIGVMHRLFVIFDRIAELSASFHLPEFLAVLSPIKYWFAEYWLPDYASLFSVHSLAGGAALGGLIVIGPRVGRYNRTGISSAMPAHNLPLAGIGLFFLWVGGQSFSPPIWQFASYSAFAGLLSSLVWTRWRFGKADPSFTITAFWAGLVAGFGTGGFELLPSILVGVVSGVASVVISTFLDKRFIDDPVGIVSAEGITPLIGLIFQWLWHKTFWGIGLVGWATAFGMGFIVVLIVGRLLWVLGIMRPDPYNEIVGIDQKLYGISSYPEFELREQ